MRQAEPLLAHTNAVWSLLRLRRSNLPCVAASARAALASILDAGWVDAMAAARHTLVDEVRFNDTVASLLGMGIRVVEG